MSCRLRLRREDYTVGWICALPVELAAAQEMLDEEHEDLECDDDNENLYSLGSVAGHNVVIVCLPAGCIGNNPAAAVAMQTKATFKGIRFGLMVGIGGGVPGLDIRLGDVVVSQPHQTFGGVVQYDVGKTTPSGFERTGSLNSPPQVLLSAVSKVQANKRRGKSKLSEYLSKLDCIPEFQRDKAGPDVLFQAAYDHEGGQACELCNTDKQEARHPREREEVEVHYGTIASGNQVMRDGRMRDRLSSELGGVLCFEMEAAGLMNNFPCLVIRGICDYADSHKNKKWQPYAAGTAAAYAKELLSVIPPTAKTRNLSNYSISSMEPLSVAASVVGLLVVGSHLSSSLSSTVTKVHDAPNLALSLRQEITDISATLGHLQPYITGRTKASADRASLILLEDMLTTLTGCVTAYSDLQAILDGLNFNPEIGAFNRTESAQQESKITVILQRLRDHRLSLYLIWKILHCKSKQEAEDSNWKLCALVKQALESDQDLKVRIKRLEHEGSIYSDAASRIGASDDLSIIRETTDPTCSPLLGMDRAPPHFPFEQDLAGSRVYNKPGNRHSLSSLTSSILYATALSLFSKLSLSEVSNISFYALPVYEFNLGNSEYYVFGEEGVGRDGIRDVNSVDEVPDNASFVQRSGSATSELLLIGRQMPRRLLGRFARRQQDDTEARSQAIDRNLARDSRKLRRECKVLLLGDEKLRRDIARTFKIIHQNGFTTEELAMYRLTIYKNVIDCAKALIGAMHQFNIAPEEPGNDKYCQYLLEYTVDPDPERPLDLQVGRAITSVWRDPCISKVLERSSEFYLMDSAPYFFDEVMRIANPNYIPIESDVLRAHTKPNGIFETRFIMGQFSIHLFDVGGKGSETKKWIHCFANIPSIIFVVDLTSYDKNRMLDSLVLFDSVVNSRWFMRTSSVILLLGNVYEFKSKLAVSPLANYFPDYSGGNDVNRAAKYILWRFNQVNRARLNLYPHLIQIHDRSNVRLVFAAIKETILQSYRVFDIL